MTQGGYKSFHRPDMIGPDMAVNGPYEYHPLPSKAHIRLLVLNSGAGDDALQGCIKIAELESLKPGSFEAISYTWGSGRRVHSILVDDKTLWITQNMREALVETRLPDGPRVLWADSICINQDDIIEKGQQVSLMGRIYKAARRTLICLGLEQHNKEKALSVHALVRDVEGMIDNVMQDPGFRYEYDSFPWPDENDPLAVDTRWLSAWDFLVHHPWFERGWVVQEAALSSDAVVHWAGTYIKWMSLLKVDNWLYYRAIPSTRPSHEKPSDIHAMHSNTFHLRRPREAMTFISKELGSSIQAQSSLSILQHARELKLMDPRDRIYAFMALKTSDKVMEQLGLRPDYARSHQEICHDFAVRYLQLTSNLEIMTHADHDEDELANLRGVPSWVPQWNNEANVSPVHVHDTSCQRNRLGDFMHPSARAEPFSGDELQLQGIVIGVVHHASRRVVKDQENPIEQVLGIWQELKAEQLKLETSLMKHLGFAFLDIVTLGRHRGELTQWDEAKKEFGQCLELNNESALLRGSTRDIELHRHAKRISLMAINRVENRHVIVLGQGFIGVTSAAACPGDVCVLVDGLCSPLILRHACQKQDRYVLVRNAYVIRGTEVVDGEVFALRTDADHEEWTTGRAYMPVQNIILV